MTDKHQMGNIFQSILPPDNEEQVDVLHELSGVRIERIVSHEHKSDDGFWYQQSEDEWVYLVEGEGELLFEQDQKRVVMQKGDYCFIPAGVRHRVERTKEDSKTIWLAIFLNTAI